MTAQAPSLRVIGNGRAGGAMMAALAACGWKVLPPLGRGDDLAQAPHGADVVMVATPDAVVGEVAGSFGTAEDQVVCHLAGSLGLDALAGHPRPASVHPLLSLPDAQLGAERLRAGGWFAVAGDPMADHIVEALGGQQVRVADADRVRYHAAAAIASNHMVALLGQVDRIATEIGVPLQAYLDLARGSLDNVAAVGAREALTGPAARGDHATLTRHRDSLAAHHPMELPAYDALVELAMRLRDTHPSLSQTASGPPESPAAPADPQEPR